VAVTVALSAAGLALLLFAMRLVAASVGCAFSPFPYLGLPSDPGWQAVLLAILVASCVALVALLVGEGRDVLWLAAADGGVLVPADAVEGLLRDAALRHAEVVRVGVVVSVRRGAPVARLEVALRPLVDRDTVAGELAAAAIDLLTRVTGVAGADVRVKARVLTVRQLAGQLP
jgi:hypothetical protein